MADVQVRTWRQAVTALSTGNQDFTLAGLGAAAKHKACIIHAVPSNVMTDGTPLANAIYCLGAAVSSSARASFGARYADNLNTNCEGHIDYQTHVFTRINSTANSLQAQADFVGFIDDGIRLNFTNDAPVAYDLYITVFSGDDVQADLKIVTPSATLNGTVNTTISKPFNLLYGFATGDPFDGALNHLGQAPLHLFYGRKASSVGSVSLVGGSFGWFKTDGTLPANATQCYANISNNRFAMVDPSDSVTATAEEYAFETTSSTNLQTTSHKVSGVAPALILLLIDTGPVDVWVGMMDTPTATGSQSLNAKFTPSIPFDPQYQQWHTNTITAALNTYQANNGAAGVWGISTFDGTRSYSTEVGCQQGVTTSNTFSLDNVKLFDVIPHDQGATDDIQATATAFQSGGLVADFTAVGASAYHWPSFAVSKPATQPPRTMHQFRQRVA